VPRGPTLGLLAALLLCEGIAGARDPASAEALFRAGRDALKRGEWSAACTSFGKSLELDPAAGTALNLAVCEEKQGHFASAWLRMRQAVDLLPPGDERRPLALERVAQLEPHVPHLTVRLAPGAPSGTRVVFDDLEMSGVLVGFAQPIDPGRHVVVVVAPDHERRAYTATSIEGQSSELVVEPGPRLPPPPVRAGSNRRTVGLVAGGIGASAVAMGVVTGLTLLRRGDERSRLCTDTCPNTTAEANARSVDANGNLLSVISASAFAVGALGLAAGAYLVLTAPKGGATELALTTSPAAGGASVLLGGSF
jgi:hypothetical protein